MITTRQRGNRTYVSLDGRMVAIMERSPWTGEFCYGLRIELPERTGKSIGPDFYFRPPFTPTQFRTAKAAAKVAAAAFTN